MKLIKIVFISFYIISCKTKPSVSDLEKKNSIENIVILTDTQAKNVGIILGKLEEKNIATLIKVNGKIDVPPQNLVSVSVPLGGYLKSTKLLPGMHINKGEIIAVMQDQQYIQLQQDYLITKSKLQYAELDFNRQKELNASQSSSDKVMQLAQAEMNQLSIIKNALAEKLKLININSSALEKGTISKEINIYSGIDGYVSKVNVNIGKYVNATDVLFELINPTDIHLNLKIFEKDVSKIFIGQNLFSYNNTNPTKKHACEIILINKDVTSEGFTEVHCHFEDYDKTLLPGMYMNAEINLKNTVVKALPDEAIVNFEAKEYIFIETKKGNYSMQLVELGSKQNGYTSILNSSKFLNQTIVTKGAYALLMKLRNVEED